MTAGTVVVLLSALSYSSIAFTLPSPMSSRAPIGLGVDGYGPRRSSSSSSSACNAKKRKNSNSSENQWYEDVDEDASPEDVFWEEMERRRLLSQSGVGEMSTSSFDGPSPIDMLSMMDDSSTTTPTTTSVSSTIVAQASSMGGGFGYTDDFIGPGSNTAMSSKNPGLTIAEVRSAEATLAAYAEFAVPDNFLYDDDIDDDERSNKVSLRNNKSLWEGEELTLDEENAELNRQLDELEREFMGDGVDGSVVGGSSPYFDPTLSDEPWDRYGQSKQADDAVDENDGSEKNSVFHKELERKMKMVSENAKEFLLDYEEDHPEEAEAEALEEEEEYTKSLSYISITSPRLENAAVNPKAEAYFQRPPDQLQGYDVMWVSAVDTPCVRNLYGVFCDYGVQFADNFDDWDEGSVEGGDSYRSIEDIASYKARKVYEVTRLPCIASRTSFEVEPIRPEDMDSSSSTSAAAAVGAGGKKVKPSPKSPRVTTGYKFNNIGEHVDRIVQSLLPFSEPTRVTRFRSCVCYYDGEMELFEYGELDCDLYFSGSMRTFLPMSAAINSILNSLELALDLQFQKWLKAKVNDVTAGGIYSDASLKLRDRVLKEAKVLPNDIIDVSSFMDAFVDVDLMDQCGKELAQRFATARPSKILTIATTGLVVAIRKFVLS
jgi:hypothetical protein